MFPLCLYSRTRELSCVKMKVQEYQMTVKFLHGNVPVLRISSLIFNSNTLLKYQVVNVSPGGSKGAKERRGAKGLWCL